jgi:predicted membrane protein
MRLTLFGDVDEGGLPDGWTKEKIVVGFGDVELDLSQRPPGPQASLTVFRLFGDVRVKAPSGLTVQLGGVTLFGNRKARVAAGDGQRVLLKVHGIAGDVTVEGQPSTA